MVRKGNGVKFEWHPAKAESNLVGHGVTFSEAQEAFDDDYGVVFPDGVNSEEEARFRLIGASKSRLLLISYTLREDSQGAETIRIISAREAESWEKRKYYEL